MFEAETDVYQQEREARLEKLESLINEIHSLTKQNSDDYFCHIQSVVIKRWCKGWLVQTDYRRRQNTTFGGIR